MRLFKISRIITTQGTFRVSGQWSGKSDEANDLIVTSLEIMSTDGWSELELRSDNTRSKMTKIKHQLLDHIISTNKF